MGSKSRRRETAAHHVDVGLTRGSGHMKYKGYVKGDVVILKTPLSVPDGTEVDIFIAAAPEKGHQEKRSIAEETFGMIQSGPALVRTVLEEDLYEA
jgi:hypothetical protein